MAVGSKGGSHTSSRPLPEIVLAKTCVGEQHVNVGVTIDYAHPGASWTHSFNMICATPDCRRAVIDIVVWLRSLGLGKYEAAFRENEIDETVLPSLTEEHLKQLGVTALGHRVKLLDAIATLRNDASGKAPLVDAATASSTPSAHPEDRAERRQVTVM
jgi:hypothetical protein